MPIDTNDILWPGAQLKEGLKHLAVHMGRNVGQALQQSRWELASHPNEWLQEQGAAVELNAQRVELAFGELKRKLPHLGPCIIKLSTDDGQPAYLVVTGTSRRGLNTLSRDGKTHRVSINQLIDRFITLLEQKSDPGVEQMINRFKQTVGGLSKELHRKLFISLMAGSEVNRIWTFSVQETDSVVKQLRDQGAVRYLVGFLFGLFATQLFFVASWYTLGANVLAGRSGTDWYSIWLILIFGYVVSRLYSRKKQLELSLLISVVIKRRMLMGMTAMPLERVKQDGPCNLLTRCYEAGQFESASVGLVLSAISALITLLVAMGTLISVQLWSLLVAFLFVCVIATVIMRQMFLIESEWTEGRLTLTHSLAELMIGQRTRRVQESAQLRHRDQDRELTQYIDLQSHRDLLQVIYGLISSAWNVMGLGVLLFGFATNTSAVNLLAGAGIWILISTAITQLSAIYLQVIRVIVAWMTISPLMGRTPVETASQKALMLPNELDADRLLEIRDLAYRYPGRKKYVLDGCTLRLGSTDKIILEGRSGSGKSTLISLLTGIRPPSRGSILLGGIERNMVTRAEWGRRVVMVPQYHENYLFTETLAFNLLLGTQWPAEPDQLERARTICHELGLTHLLNKMPSELMQVVGEMGWTLSHGEKSRVFVARAILQEPDLIILDESLASLDPENTHRVLACVEKYCKAVIIVAHP